MEYVSPPRNGTGFAMGLLYRIRETSAPFTNQANQAIVAWWIFLFPFFKPIGCKHSSTFGSRFAGSCRSSRPSVRQRDKCCAFYLLGRCQCSVGPEDGYGAT